MTAEKPVRLAVDIGGTFVDALAYDENSGTLRLHKAPTTPDAPAQGVLDAVRGLHLAAGSGLGVRARDHARPQRHLAAARCRDRDHQ